MKELTSDTIWKLWSSIQNERPLIHCITNYITANDCANILLAAGASPTMAHHPMEAAEVTEGCKSLVCNLGATEFFDSMLTAGRHARELDHPVVLDPVGVSGASFRRELCFTLMKELTPITSTVPLCIRGNFSEIKALATHQKVIIGVDAADSDTLKGKIPSDAVSLVKDFAGKVHAIVIASGAVDIISDGDLTYGVQNGSRLMSRITGSGCMSSALLGAFLGTEMSLASAAAACTVMGICGELAEKATLQQHGGTMTFRNLLIDAVSLLEKEQIEELNRTVLL